MSVEHEQAVDLLAAAYLPHPLSDRRMAVYVFAVDDLDPDDVRLAVAGLVRQSRRYMPNPGEVRQAVLRLREGEPPDPGDAWCEVVEAFSRVGRHAKPDWSHPLIGQAVAAVGGWRMLCDSELPAADRAQFIKAFERLAERTERETLVSPGLAPAVAAALPDLSIADPQPLTKSLDEWTRRPEERS